MANCYEGNESRELIQAGRMADLPNSGTRGQVHMHYTHVAAITLLLAFAGSAAVDAAENETVGQFLISMPVHSVDPVIDYCSESVPEIKDELLKERAGLIEKLTEAARPLMEKFKDDPEFNAPVQEAMRKGVAKAHSDALNIFKQRDPEVTCRTGLENMQNATVDSLCKVVEDTYQKFRNAGQVNSSE